MVTRDQLLYASLDIMRRLPPQQVQTHLVDLIDTVPELCEDLLFETDVPLKVAKDKTTGQEYILCDFNRDGDSYRSPWSNKYDPPIDNGAVPSDKSRSLEILMNDVFNKYREIYFGSRECSVYVWDSDIEFTSAILLKKTEDTDRIKASWDSIHVVRVLEKGRSAWYRLTSTIILRLRTLGSALGTMDLGGSLTMQVEEDNPISFENAHIHNIGRMVEGMENMLRDRLYKVYFEKTQDIVSNLRNPERIQR